MKSEKGKLSFKEIGVGIFSCKKSHNLQAKVSDVQPIDGRRDGNRDDDD